MDLSLKSNQTSSSDDAINKSNKHGRDITLQNKDVEIVVDTIGGTIKKVKLLNYFETTDVNSKNINLFDYENEFYVGQSGLLHDKNSSKQNQEKLAPNHHDLFVVSKEDGQKVTLEWKDKSGKIEILKKISLNDSGYKINLENIVINKSDKAWAEDSTDKSEEVVMAKEGLG